MCLIHHWQIHTDCPKRVYYRAIELLYLLILLHAPPNNSRKWPSFCTYWGHVYSYYYGRSIYKVHVCLFCVITTVCETKKKKKKPLLSSSSLSKQIVLVVRFPSYKTFPLCSSRCNNQWYFISCRLNGLRWVKSDNLEAVSQVTQLDLRDNCLDSLDLSSISNLETLHCQRNQMGTLTLSGFTLRMLHASSNRESNKAPASCCYCLTGCLSVGSGPPPHSFYEGTYDGPDV